MILRGRKAYKNTKEKEEGKERMLRKIKARNARKKI